MESFLFFFEIKKIGNESDHAFFLVVMPQNSFKLQTALIL
jgi:hypothetical protein